MSNKSHLNIKYGVMIEDYIANGMQLKDIAKKYNVQYSFVSKLISRFFKKPETNLILKSKV